MPFDGGLSERLPTQDEIEKSLMATRALANFTDHNGVLRFRLPDGQDESLEIELPAAVYELVLELLLAIGRGESVTLVPFGSILTTQQAADLLNVSRPFLIKLIESKKIPCTKVGTHRRLQAEDVLAYKHKRDEERSLALDELAALSQEIEGE